MISLVRRPERRNRMIACLDELGFDYIVFDAVDGRYNILTKIPPETIRPRHRLASMGV